MSADLLRRSQAPLAAAAWDLIDEQARTLISATLTARKLVDVSGPHGITHAALNLGTLDPASIDTGNGVFYGIRRVLPLAEVRVPFALDTWQLDDVVRGARSPELGPLLEAAGKLVAFEEHAIYEGLSGAAITGMRRASQHPAQALAPDARQWPEAIARASVALKLAGVAQPHAFVASAQVFEAIEHHVGQYPLRKQIESLIEGPIVLAPYVAGAFLLPATPDGDFELVLGQDIAIGFERHDGRNVHLYLTESFTFRAIEPLAVVAFAPQRDAKAAA